MKFNIIRGAIAGLTLAVFCAFNIHAAPLETAPQKPAAKAKTPSTAEGLLTEAYADLDRADHDYKGHRIAAMKQIEEAAKALKLNLGGDGRGHEKQGVSDEQLAAAEGLLNQAKSDLAAEKHKKVLHHVNKALEELHTALKIK
jgi:hypothetical protein